VTVAFEVGTTAESAKDKSLFAHDFKQDYIDSLRRLYEGIQHLLSCFST